MGRFRHALHPPHRIAPEGQLGPSGRAEQVRYQRESGTPDTGKQESGSAGGDHTTMDFRRFETRIDLDIDRRQFTVTSQLLQEISQIQKGQTSSPDSAPRKATDPA